LEDEVQAVQVTGNKRVHMAWWSPEVNALQQKIPQKLKEY